MIQILLCLTLLWIQNVQANTEKTIFLAPDPLALPQDASIDNLLLIPLTPDHPTYRTYLNVSFPTDEKPHGEDTWVLLERMAPGQRHEFRVCWLATQPTTFWIDTFSLSTVFESPDLITSLSSYSYSRHGQLDRDDIRQLQERRHVSNKDEGTSLLLLRIQAAADYFSLNTTLMEQVPPVHVDLILDPYLLSIFPQSLGLTAIYTAVVAILAWFLSGWTFRRLTSYVTVAKQDDTTQSKKSK